MVGDELANAFGGAGAKSSASAEVAYEPGVLDHLAPERGLFHSGAATVGGYFM